MTLREAIKKTIESVIMIILCWSPPPFFLTVITIGFSLSLFSDPFGSQVHSKTNFGKFWVKFEQNNANSGQNLFQQIRGERPNTHAQMC